MSTVNEFAINLPISSVGPVVDMTAAAVVPADVDTAQCDHINVYADSASIVNYSPTDPQVLIDLVLNVNVNDHGAGVCKSYKLIKRLSLDKCKLACEAEGLTPHVVEELDKPEDYTEIMEAFYAGKRAREMAGITESAGKKTAAVLISYDDPSGSGRASTTINVNAVKDKAHAKHVFDVNTSQTGPFKAKYKNAKITRITMKD
jgi:hypothetical protein